MVRFKVIKGSHLLLGISVFVLLSVLVFIGLQLLTAQETAGLTTHSEAKVAQTFASSDNVRIRIQPDPEPTSTPAPKSVLIYHTHTHEAYEQVENDPYVAIETWRTDDPEHSVVRVGSALADELTQFGFRVIHDRTDHELDKLSDSYVRSLKTLEGYTEKFDLYIDLHRDAFAEGMLPCLNGENEYAQLMMLVGRGDRYDGLLRPDYESNLHFAQNLTVAMNDIVPGICRNVTVKTGRYNQHIGTPSILMEFGHNKNTLQQALNSVPIATQAIAALLK